MCQKQAYIVYLYANKTCCTCTSKSMSNINIDTYSYKSKQRRSVVVVASHLSTASPRTFPPSFSTFSPNKVLLFLLQLSNLKLLLLHLCVVKVLQNPSRTNLPDSHWRKHTLSLNGWRGLSKAKRGGARKAAGSSFFRDQRKVGFFAKERWAASKTQ